MLLKDTPAGECLWCGKDGAKGGYCSEFCRKADQDDDGPMQDHRPTHPGKPKET